MLINNLKSYNYVKVRRIKGLRKEAVKILD